MERPDTDRLREASRLDRDHWWPRDYEAVAAAADWIDAQSVRGDGPGIEELRALVAAYRMAEAMLEEAQRTGSHYNDPNAPYAIRTARALALADAAADYIDRSLLAAVPPATSPEPDGRGLAPDEFVSRPCDVPPGNYEVLHLDVWRPITGAWRTNTTRYICRPASEAPATGDRTEKCQRCGGSGREMVAEVQIGAPSCLRCYGSGLRS